jgi:hypothetical protein
MADLLETADFINFWTLADSHKDITLLGFSDAIRQRRFPNHNKYLLTRVLCVCFSLSLSLIAHCVCVCVYCVVCLGVGVFVCVFCFFCLFVLRVVRVCVSFVPLR